MATKQSEFTLFFGIVNYLSRKFNDTSEINVILVRNHTVLTAKITSFYGIMFKLCKNHI